MDFTALVRAEMARTSALLENFADVTARHGAIQFPSLTDNSDLLVRSNATWVIKDPIFNTNG